jgi:hypothetical protein
VKEEEKMPHYSKKQEVTTSLAQYATGSMHAQQSFPPEGRRDYSSAADQHPQQQQQLSVDESKEYGETTDPHSAYTHHQRHHRVPVSPAEKHDQPNVESGSSNDEEDAEEEREDESRASPSREMAASVLLLAAAAGREILAMEKEEDRIANGSRPIKKRKTVAADIMLRKAPLEEEVGSEPRVAAGEATSVEGVDAFHVSPMSTHSQKSGAASDRGPEPASSSSSGVVMSSYEVSAKEGSDQTLAASIKSKESDYTLKHFPSALHWLLSESSSPDAASGYTVVNTVLTWVSHGQAFRVVRWDAFRRHVIPKFFPQFSGSLDAFLSHVAAWGFEEIKDGPDIGAFAHSVCSSVRDRYIIQVRCHQTVYHTRSRHNFYFSKLCTALPPWPSSIVSQDGIQCRKG